MSDILDMGGRVSLVTGAGQGVGAQIAKHLASASNSGGVAVNDACSTALLNLNLMHMLEGL